MYRIILIIILNLTVFLQAAQGHDFPEAKYQHAWCSAHHGVEEYVNSDYTRVDCLTNTHAVAFDFAKKWAESIGQALHYQEMTGKKAKVVLILEQPNRQMCYFKRVSRQKI